MSYFIDVAKKSKNGGLLISWSGKDSFESITQARAALIRLMDKKPKGVVFDKLIYEGPGAAKFVRGRIDKYGNRYMWTDYKDNSDYAHKEIYKNGTIKKVWVW